MILWPRGQRPSDTDEVLNLEEILAGADTAGYARAVSSRTFRFPADHGPHPRFKTEWWYFTGNVASESGNRFGFQITFFRSALGPVEPAGESSWRTNQIFMGHFAFTDVSRSSFRYRERFSRAAAGLAGATAEPFRVWLEDWRAESVDPSDRSAVPAIRLYAAEEGVEIDLGAASAKAPVLQGDNGLSPKGTGAGNASYYYSLTRMSTEGTVTVDGRSFEVAGAAWMDREWSTSALEEGQAGWDWFSLQLDDGTELMYYQLRRDDGAADQTSRGAFVGVGGDKTTLLPSEVGIEVVERWESPRGGTYPAGWRLVVEDLGLDVRIAPLVADQELDVSLRYWEGAVRAEGSRSGRPVTGYGYVELTGYAR
jgi:predicted secreted hydrolase